MNASLTPYLREVLSALAAYRGGITADQHGEPDAEAVAELAERLHSDVESVRQALLGLRASDCLVEFSVEFPGIEPFYRWEPHPQCLS